MKAAAKVLVSCMLLASLLLSMFLVFQGPARAALETNRTLNVRLYINNTSNTVFIPGTGAVSAAGLGASGISYTSPRHHYLASYAGGAVYGLVAANSSGINASKTGSSHVLRLDQNLTNSQVFLAFTEGDYRKVEERVSLIESGGFLSEIAPSFGFGLGVLYPVKLVLKYTNIDIRGNLTLHYGRHGVMVNYTTTTASRPVIEIKRV